MERRGREYRAVIEIPYLGGTLPDDPREALRSALAADLGVEARDLSFDVSLDPYTVVTIAAVFRGTSPVAAITRLNTALDRSLLVTGLFETFDVSGKMLQAAPIRPVVNRS
jgi:hypothetical protein